MPDATVEETLSKGSAVPAHRSRTDRWRVSLQKIYERGGGLEFMIDRQGHDDGFKDLVWRVRVLSLSEDEILIEQPGAMGQSFMIENGIDLIGVISVGQNKWTFKTKVLGSTLNQTRSGTFPALRIAMPQMVKRCMRRVSDRTSVNQMDLPKIECWKLLDPMSAVPVEVANRVLVTDMIADGASGAGSAPFTDDLMALPTVGPKFEARLSNIGGGGVGLIVPNEFRGDIDSGTTFFIRLDLRPAIPAPIVLTTKLAHSHIDSEQNTYAGMSFEFSMNNPHKEFIVKQISRYISTVQSVKRAA